MRKIIGIVGGVGPYAGLEFNKKIFDHTPSQTDQDHLEVVLISASPKISDRTEYLLNPENTANPALAVFSVITRLKEAGAELVAIPCNTFHSPLIWDVLMEMLDKSGTEIKILHLIEETFNYLRKENPDIKKIGLLATRGTYLSRVYDLLAQKNHIELLTPSPDGIEEVHASIYDPAFGIKAKSNPVTDKATAVLRKNGDELIHQGAQAIILGCTEIPLALREGDLPVALYDPMDITARTLVELATKSKVKNY